MTYQAKPIRVEAWVIENVGDLTLTGRIVTLDVDGQPVTRTATSEMTARHVPSVGDYWVVQDDGYEYLNPRDVFERKYAPA